jgi:hypothetical protein
MRFFQIFICLFTTNQTLPYGSRLFTTNQTLPYGSRYQKSKVLILTSLRIKNIKKTFYFHSAKEVHSCCVRLGNLMHVPDSNSCFHCRLGLHLTLLPAGVTISCCQRPHPSHILLISLFHLLLYVTVFSIIVDLQILACAFMFSYIYT